MNRKEEVEVNILENISEAISETISNNLEDKISSNMEKQEIIDRTNISNEEIEVAQKLHAIEEYVIDRFEGNKAVLENRETGEMKDIEKDKLPKEAEEGSILNCINEKYFLNQEKTREVEKNVQDRFNKLLKDK